MSFTIRVPATTANIGPGFDSLGAALSLFNTFIVERATRTTITGCEEKYRGPENLFLEAFDKACRAAGHATPCLALAINSKIPIARGLGSSAAMIVGGVTASVMLARTERGRSLDDSDKKFILEMSAALEGHPDNAAPAVFGGFCVSARIDTTTECQPVKTPIGSAGAALPKIAVSRHDIPSGWAFHAMIPPFELTTADARAALPSSYSRSDAVFNLGRAALVSLAFATGDAELLGAACEDRIHQPYRKDLIPGYDEVESACRRAGAKAVWLSGAGPTIMALTDRSGFEPDLSAPGLENWIHLELAPDRSGVTVEFGN